MWPLPVSGPGPRLPGGQIGPADKPVTAGGMALRARPRPARSRAPEAQHPLGPALHSQGVPRPCCRAGVGAGGQTGESSTGRSGKCPAKGLLCRFGDVAEHPVAVASRGPPRLAKSPRTPPPTARLRLARDPEHPQGQTSLLEPLDAPDTMAETDTLSTASGDGRDPRAGRRR